MDIEQLNFNGVPCLDELLHEKTRYTDVEDILDRAEKQLRRGKFIDGQNELSLAVLYYHAAMRFKGINRFYASSLSVVAAIKSGLDGSYVGRAHCLSGLAHLQRSKLPQANGDLDHAEQALEQSMADFTQAVDVARGNLDYEEALGHVRILLGKYKKFKVDKGGALILYRNAENDLQRAAADRSTYRLHNLLATAQLQQALLDNPERFQHHMQRALQNLGRAQTALARDVSAYRVREVKSADYFPPQFTIADYWCVVGNRERALSACEAAIDFFGTTPVPNIWITGGVIRMLSNLQAKNSKYEPKLRQYIEGAAMHPQTVRFVQTY